jgi:hypothetical protein
MRFTALLPAILFIAPMSLPAQEATSSQRTLPPAATPWRTVLAVGPSFFYGAEGNTVGLQVESALLRRLFSDRSWMRAELGAHIYGQQPLYPCMLREGSLCFSTSQRAIVSAGLAVQHVLMPATATRTSTFYVVGGVGGYFSARRALRIPNCEMDVGVCDASLISSQFTDSDFGANLGVGQTWRIASRELFVESRFHQLLWRQHRDDPYSIYRIFPLTVGLRF